MTQLLTEHPEGLSHKTYDSGYAPGMCECAPGGGKFDLIDAPWHGSDKPAEHIVHVVYVDCCWPGYVCASCLVADLEFVEGEVKDNPGYLGLFVENVKSDA